MARRMSGYGALEFSPTGEEWLEYGPPDARRRIGFHDYAAIYAEPGLYEYVFYETLGMRSTREVVRMYAEVLDELGLDITRQRVVDFGAGNGLGGEDLHARGVGELVGVDLEPMARTAAERDRPGVYDDYLVGDLGAWSEQEMGRLRDHRPTALLALSAIGLGHVPSAVLDRAIGLLGPGGIYAFAVAPALLPGSTDPAGRESGYPDYLAGLLERTELLRREEYVHRTRADGSDDLGIAFVGRVSAAA
jgi:predicted TPR repeat methyltransferase